MQNSDNIMVFPNPDPMARAARLEQYLYRAIPLVTHMQVRVLELNAAHLILGAPLAPNSNHIGTGFGGSLQGLATLAGWGMVWLLLEGLHAHIVIQENRMRFLAPVQDDFTASCPVPTTTVAQQFIAAYQRRGRARLELTVQVNSGGQQAGVLIGQFVAMRAT